MVMQTQQAMRIVSEIEEIKTRLISIETGLIASEPAEKEDVEAVKEVWTNTAKAKQYLLIVCALPR